jgi:ankyrin repeat protein
LLNFSNYDRANEMSQDFFVEYLTTRALIDRNSSPLLSTVMQTAKKFSGDHSDDKLRESVKSLFSAMVGHLGPGAMLQKLEKMSKPSFSSICDEENGYRPAMLPVAIALGNVPLAKKLFDTGIASISTRSDLGLPLTISTRRGDIEMTRLLLNYRADVNDGLTFGLKHPGFALQAAALQGDTRHIKFLLQPRYRRLTYGPSYESAIYQAARGGHEDLVWFLIDRSTFFEGLVRIKSNVMIEAARAGRIGIVKVMLNHGVKVNFRDNGTQGPTALHWSTKRGYLEVTRLLLESGADPNATADLFFTYKKNPPLKLAASNGHLQILKLLLEFGASADTDTWNAALYSAACEGHFEVASFCLKQGADLSTKRESEPGEEAKELGHDLLEEACERSKYDLVRFLCEEHRYNPNGLGEPAQRSHSPMMIALRNDDERLVSILLKLGASAIDAEKAREAHLLPTRPFASARWKW